MSVTHLSWDTFDLHGRRAAIQFPWKVRRYLSENQAQYDVIDAMTGDLAWIASSNRNIARSHVFPVLITRSHGLEHVWLDSVREEIRRSNVSRNPVFGLYQFHYRLREVRRSLCMSDGIIFLNHGDVDYAVKRLDIDRGHCAVIGNAVVDELRTIQHHSTKNHQHIDIVFLGAVRTDSSTQRVQKGHHYIFNMLRQLIKEDPRIKISFLGSGKGSTDFLHRMVGVVLNNRFRVIETYERVELPQLLRDSHLFIMPSLSEGWGLALAEAMACGLVPITFDNDGARELVIEGKNGFLVVPRDVDSMTQRIRLLVDNESLRSKLSINAHRSAARYSWTTRAAQTIDFYERMIAYKRAGLPSK